MQQDMGMELADYIRHEMIPINNVLPAIGRLASQQSREALARIGDGTDVNPETYPKFYADAFLTCMRADIDRSPIEGFTLDAHTDRLHLLSPSGLKVRVLKKAKAGAPCAGRNLARQLAWVQPTLDGSRQISLDDGLDLRGCTILLAWEELHGQIVFTAYHPIDTGTLNSGAHTDLAFSIGIDPDMYCSTTFTPHADEPILVPTANYIYSEPKTKIQP